MNDIYLLIAYLVVFVSSFAIPPAMHRPKRTSEEHGIRVRFRGDHRPIILKKYFAEMSPKVWVCQ